MHQEASDAHARGFPVGCASGFARRLGKPLIGGWTRLRGSQQSATRTETRGDEST